MTVDMAPRLYESVAIGGPLNGVKLSAPLSWDGLIALPRQNDTGKAIRHHPGRYIWSARHAWLWRDSEPTAYCRYDTLQKRTIHKWYSTCRPGEKCLCGKQIMIRKRK